MEQADALEFHQAASSQPAKNVAGGFRVRAQNSTTAN